MTDMHEPRRGGKISDEDLRLAAAAMTQVEGRGAGAAIKAAKAAEKLVANWNALMTPPPRPAAE